MIQTIFIYTILAFCLFYFAKKSQYYPGAKSVLLYSIPIILYTIVFGIRYGVGTDYFNYLEAYEAWNITHAEDHSWEPGFVLLNSICSYFHCHATTLFSVIAFIQILLIYLTFKHDKDVLAYSMLMLIMLGIGLWNFQNGLRQAIAFVFFLFSIKFIINKKIIYFLLSIILAINFHYSAIILIPIYFLYNKEKVYFNNQKMQYIILGISAVLSILGIAQKLLGRFDSLILLLGYEKYLGSDFLSTFASGWTPYTYALIVVYFIFAYHYPNVRNFYQKDRFFEILYDLFFIGTCLNFIFLGNMMFGRILSYFTNLSFIIFGYYVNYFVHTYKYSYTNLISFFYILFYLLIFYCYAVLYHSYDHCIQYATYYQTHLHSIQEQMFNDFASNH